MDPPQSGLSFLLDVESRYSQRAGLFHPAADGEALALAYPPTSAFSALLCGMQSLT